MTHQPSYSCLLRPRLSRLDISAAPVRRIKLYCFPHAGGAPSAFFGWSELLGPEVDVVWIQQPGRGARFLEKPYHRISAMVAEIATAIAGEVATVSTDEAPLPYCFYGHSLGALVAFEVARELRRRGCRMPVHFLAGAAQAAQVEQVHSPLSHLSDDQFLFQMQTRYGGIPEAVLNEPELLKLFLPLLRADFAAFENYVYVDESPLDCPITALFGTADSTVTQESMSPWALHTNDVFTLQGIVGDHFFVTANRAVLISVIRQSLNSVWAKMAK